MRVRLSGDGAAHTAWSHHPAADISRAVEDMATADDLGEDLLVTKTVLQGDEHGLGPRHTPRLLHSAPCVEGLDQDDNDVEDIEAGRRRDGVDGHRPLRGIGPIARAHHEPVTIDRVHVCLIRVDKPDVAAALVERASDGRSQRSGADHADLHLLASTRYRIDQRGRWCFICCKCNDPHDPIRKSDNRR